MKLKYEIVVDMLSPLFVSLYQDLCRLAGTDIFEHKKKMGKKFRIIIQELDKGKGE